MENTPVELRTDKGSLLQVFPLGGKFTLSLSDNPILVSITRGDGKAGITHLCTPIFGPDRKGIYGLSQHGKMRNEPVDVQKLSQEEIVVKHTVTDEGYPSGMEVELRLLLQNNSLQLKLIHTNTGEEEAAVNAGLHFYFAAPQGYHGTKVNGQDITGIINQNPDGGLISLNEVNAIAIPEKPEIQLTQKGFSKAMMWVGKNPQTGEKDSQYVCIEPVENDPQGDFFGSPESMLRPGQSRTSECSLSISV